MAAARGPPGQQAFSTQSPTPRGAHTQGSISENAVLTTPVLWDNSPQSHPLLLCFRAAGFRGRTCGVTVHHTIEGPRCSRVPSKNRPTAACVYVSVELTWLSGGSSPHVRVAVDVGCLDHGEVRLRVVDAPHASGPARTQSSEDRGRGLNRPLHIRCRWSVSLRRPTGGTGPP